MTVLILAGLVLGIVVGQVLFDPGYSPSQPDTQHAHPTALATFQFLGDTIFLNLLRMLVTPLIATSVIIGVTTIGDVRELGRLGGYTLAYYFSTMCIAGVIGLVLVISIHPGSVIGDAQRAEAEAAYQHDVGQHGVLSGAKEQAAGGLLGAMESLVRQIIPSNPIGAAAGGQPLPVIFFSLLFGGALAIIRPRSDVVIQFVHGAFEALMVLVQAVLWLAPVGVFALLAWTVARIGLGTFAAAIGRFMITVIVGLAIHAFIVLPAVLMLFGRANPLRFLAAIKPALFTAFGTSSSSATLPISIRCAEREGGVSRKAAGFVLPLGSTINMDGTALYEAAAVVFLAQAYNVPLGLNELVLIAITATLAAVGAAGIPSAGLVTMVIVIDAVNGSVLAARPDLPAIPIAAVGLVLGVDRILDMCRTTVNVWGDLVGAKIVTRLDRGPSIRELPAVVSASDPE